MLQKLLEALRGAPRLKAVVVVWNPSSVPPPSEKTVRKWLDDSRVRLTLIVEEVNDRQNRFKPRGRDIVPTDCVLNCDDDITLTHQVCSLLLCPLMMMEMIEDLETAYDVWKLVPDVRQSGSYAYIDILYQRLVGFVPRLTRCSTNAGTTECKYNHFDERCGQSPTHALD